MNTLVSFAAVACESRSSGSSSPPVICTELGINVVDVGSTPSTPLHHHLRRVVVVNLRVEVVLGLVVVVRVVVRVVDGVLVVVRVVVLVVDGVVVVRVEVVLGLEVVAVLVVVNAPSDELVDVMLPVFAIKEQLYVRLIIIESFPDRNGL